jgi:hypothetical protein
VTGDEKAAYRDRLKGMDIDALERETWTVLRDLRNDVPGSAMLELQVRREWARRDLSARFQRNDPAILDVRAV